MIELMNAHTMSPTQTWGINSAAGNFNISE
jgi:hypothetical protein